MVGILIRPAIIAIQTAWKYRHQIYAVVTAQDRAIKGAFVGSRVSKAAQYGWRTGAAGGGIAGAFIKDDNTFQPGNGAVLQPKQRHVPKTGKSYKTRRGFTSRYGTRKYKYCKPNKYN